MTQDQSRVLDMLSEGEITVDEAERLLAALARAPGDHSESAAVADEPLESMSVVIEAEADAEGAADHDDTFSVGASPKLRVSGYNGPISVKAGPDGAIRVQTTLKNPTNVDYQATQDGDTIEVVARRRGKQSVFGFFGHGGGVRIAVTAPAATNVDLESSNGRIELRGMEAGGTVRTSNGRILVGEVDGHFEVATTNSRIEVRGIHGSGAMRTSNGRIVLEDARGEFRATTSNGSISFDGEFAPGSSNELKTVNGSVAVKLHGAPSLKIDAATTNGKVVCGLSGAASQSDKTHLVAVVGDGEAELVARTTNGSVRID